MSADAASGIWGVSARYAAQIEELLYVRAIEKMVADQEATRADAAAERAARVETPTAVRAPEEAVKVDIEVRKLPDPISLPEPAGSTVPPPATLVDVQA